jgi:hypothetical protein
MDAAIPGQIQFLQLYVANLFPPEARSPTDMSILIEVEPRKSFRTPETEESRLYSSLSMHPSLVVVRKTCEPNSKVRLLPSNLPVKTNSAEIKVPLEPFHHSSTLPSIGPIWPT